MLNFLEPSAISTLSLIAIFQRNNTYTEISAYTEIIRLSSMCQYLTEDTTTTLVNSCILSRLDYCNSLLAGYPQTVIKPLQQVHNPAAKLILKFRRIEHAKRLLKQLHWLPIEQRIKYRVAFLAIKSSLTLPLSTWLSSAHFFSQNYRPSCHVVFPFRAAVFIRLRSLFAARFKLRCVN